MSYLSVSSFLPLSFCCGCTLSPAKGFVFIYGSVRVILKICRKYRCALPPPKKKEKGKEKEKEKLNSAAINQYLLWGRLDYILF